MHDTTVEHFNFGVPEKYDTLNSSGQKKHTKQCHIKSKSNRDGLTL